VKKQTARTANAETKPLGTRYTEILALREAIRKETRKKSRRREIAR
jgi:hypothetical protein